MSTPEILIILWKFSIVLQFYLPNYKSKIPLK